MANRYPLYIFPDKGTINSFTFTNNRQAALIDDSWGIFAPMEQNPLGLRIIVTVTYTEKAFGKYGMDMMEAIGKKNGLSADDTPIINSLGDIQLLLKHEMISLKVLKFWDDSQYRGMYAISPVIANPTNGVIARDAFLFMASRDGMPLANEVMFAQQFGCLRKSGNWCP